jgi:hypothetical protein
MRLVTTWRMRPPSPIKWRDTPGAYSQHRVEHLLFRLGGKHLTDVLNHKAEIENYGFDLQLAGLDLGKIENVVNDGEKGLSRCVASIETHRWGIPHDRIAFPWTLSAERSSPFAGWEPRQAIESS